MIEVHWKLDCERMEHSKVLGKNLEEVNDRGAKFGNHI